MAFLWHISLLGEFRVQNGAEEPLHFDTRQTTALLAYLSFYGHRAHSREILAEHLWPDEDVNATRARLRTALWAIRRLLEPRSMSGTVLNSSRSDVQLLAHAFTTDVANFEQAIEKAEKAKDPVIYTTLLNEALELYNGELLPGFYENWIPTERERLATLYRKHLLKAAINSRDLNNLSLALEFARKATTSDPYWEEAHQILIDLYIRGGQQVEAIRHYQEFERMLRKEMGLKPSDAIRNQIAHIQTSKSPTASSQTWNSSLPVINLFALEPEGGSVPDRKSVV